MLLVALFRTGDLGLGSMIPLENVFKVKILELSCALHLPPYYCPSGDCSYVGRRASQTFQLVLKTFFAFFSSSKKSPFFSRQQSITVRPPLPFLFPGPLSLDLGTCQRCNRRLRQNILTKHSLFRLWRVHRLGLVSRKTYSRRWSLRGHGAHSFTGCALLTIDSS